MQSPNEEWAEDHGYTQHRCRECGRVFWADGDPECECQRKIEDEGDLILYGDRQEWNDFQPDNEAEGDNDS